jgi:hypothetical protein
MTGPRRRPVSLGQVRPESTGRTAVGWLIIRPIKEERRRTARATGRDHPGPRGNCEPCLTPAPNGPRRSVSVSVDIRNRAHREAV